MKTFSKNNHRPRFFRLTTPLRLGPKALDTRSAFLFFQVCVLFSILVWALVGALNLRGIISSSSLDHLHQGPPSTTLGAIVLLAPQRNEGSIWDIDRFCFLLRAVRSIDHHLNSKFGPYPIYILVAKDFSSDPRGKDGEYTVFDRSLIQRWAPHSKVTFVEVEMYSGLALEPNSSVDIIEKWRSGFDGSVPGRSLGYQSMCRLWSGRLQNLPFLNDKMYYMRLDDDSLLTADLDYDPFARMRSEDLLYVYRRRAVDHWGIEKLWSIAKSHIDLADDLPFLGFDREYKGDQPYNNFHISKVSFWRDGKWWKLWQALNKEHAFFKYRVGDANVHAIAAMMMGKDKIAEWNEFPYVHNSNDDTSWGKKEWKDECQRSYDQFLG